MKSLRLKNTLGNKQFVPLRFSNNNIITEVKNEGCFY